MCEIESLIYLGTRIGKIHKFTKESHKISMTVRGIDYFGFFGFIQKSGENMYSPIGISKRLMSE